MEGSLISGQVLQDEEPGDGLVEGTLEPGRWGIDSQSIEALEENLTENLKRLHEELKDARITLSRLYPTLES